MGRWGGGEVGRGGGGEVGRWGGGEVGRCGGGEVAPLVRHKMFRVYSKTIKDKVVPASSCLCLSAEDTGGGTSLI